MLGSILSYSYLPYRKWWMNLLPDRRHQKKEIAVQFDHGARLFDVCLRFRDNGELLLTDGPMEYKGSRYILERGLEYLTERAAHTRDSIYVRVILDIPEEDITQDIYFMRLCSDLVKTFPDIIFVGGYRRGIHLLQSPGNSPVYSFNEREPFFLEEYIVKEGFWQNLIYNISPSLYYRMFRRNPLPGSHILTEKDTAVMLDFI